MPDEWAKATLGDVADVASSGVNKHVVPGETSVRLCNYLDVYRNRRLTNDMKFSRGSATAAEIARFTLRRNDVVITKDSETPDDIGVPTVVVDDLENLVCGYHLAIIRPGPTLDSHFLLHYLLSDQTKRHFLRTANGLTRFGLGTRAISSLTVPMPPADEQAAIARILDAVDTVIEHTRAAVERALELERSLLEDAIDKLAAPQRKLSEFTSDVRYGTSKASSDRKWGNPVLRIPNVTGDRLSLDDLATVELPPAEVARLRLDDGDLLLVRTNGNPNYVGRSVVFRHPDDRTWVYASYLIRVRLKDGLLSDYVNVFLGIERGRRELLRRVTTSAGNHNINSNSIRLLSLPVPRSTDAQEKIVNLAHTCRARVDALRARNTALETLKRSLMHDLLTGRVRVLNDTSVAAT
jgi:type I restriction enzyme S subunit